MSKHILKKGFGYWDVTKYPVGGCFKRAIEDMPLEQVGVPNTYNNGMPREYSGTYKNNQRIVCKAEATEVLTVNTNRED
jgi:hypothetical protein